MMDAIAQLKSALAGRYSVEKEIGRGGMATVYLARDVRHNRPVALKVLNPELGAVLGTERFLSEIQVTANLQHPNLLPLFDSGEADGLLFYVMPYVEGESLRAKLHREKQLPIDESVHIATAVLSALDYAHRHGVIHRDLKPENILMHEGQPLVADFGIALAVSNAGGNRITQTGLSLGTPQYMSPEQATGDREVDGRTDVYSLGAVLYEMLTGEPPHDGKTSQAIIAKVLTDKPRNLRLTRDTIPLHVEAATERALAKLPADRFHSAHEFADALLGKSVAIPTNAHTPGTIQGARSAMLHASRLQRVLPWAAAATGLTLAALAWLNRDARDNAVLRYEIPLPRTSIAAQGVGNPIAISPGGRHVAFAGVGEDGVRRIYIKAADELQAREVGASVAGRNPVFSPDGQWIAFYAAGQWRKASVGGGTSALLGEGSGAGRASWTSRGEIIASAGGRLARMSANGGRFVPFTTIDSASGETGQLAPIVLSDGRTVLYASLAMGGATATRIGIASLKDGSSEILDIQGSYPIGMLDQHLLYSTANGTVMAVPFDLDRRAARGAPIPVIDQVSMESTGEAFVNLTTDGDLVMYSGSNRRRLMSVTWGEPARPLMADAQNIQWPRLSPNGKRVAMTIVSAGRSDIWIYDLPSGPLVRLTTQGTVNDRPEWMPDGKSVLFRSNRGPLNAIWVQPVDGAGGARLFYGQKEARIDEGVLSPDSKYLLFQRDSTGVADLWYLPLFGDTTPKPIETSPVAEMGGRFSPDGRWIAYSSAESGATQIYVRPFPSLGVRYQVSLDGGATPIWSRDGRSLFYTSARKVIQASITTLPVFSVNSRKTVIDRVFTFAGIHADYDLTADGKQLIGLQPSDEDAQLIVVHNWVGEFRSRIRGSNR